MKLLSEMDVRKRLFLWDLGRAIAYWTLDSVFGTVATVLAFYWGFVDYSWIGWPIDLLTQEYYGANQRPLCWNYAIWFAWVLGSVSILILDWLVIKKNRIGIIGRKMVVWSLWLGYSLGWILSFWWIGNPPNEIKWADQYNWWFYSVVSGQSLVFYWAIFEWILIGIVLYYTQRLVYRSTN